MRKQLFSTLACALFGVAAFGQADDSTFAKILNFVDCGIAKTFTFKLEAECQPTETIVRRWLLKDVGTPAENSSLYTFYFAIVGEDKYELTKGKSLWPEFAKKMSHEIDSLNGLDAKHRSEVLGLSKKDSLHTVVNRLPGMQKKRDNYWKALKTKKDELATFEALYQQKKTAYDAGDLEPAEWDATEEKYLNLKQEVEFLKNALQTLNRDISVYREAVARLKKETGLLDYKSYREGSY